jgi:hypothetical protein
MKPSYQILTALNIHNTIAPFKQGTANPVAFIVKRLAVFTYF